MSVEQAIAELQQMLAADDPQLQHKGRMQYLPATVSFTHWNAPEHGNKGEEGWDLAFRGAQIAIATYNAYMQGQIAAKQQELAESWYSHAKYKWDRFQGNYMPLEKQLLNEVRNTPEAELDCIGAEARADESVRTAYDVARGAMSRRAKALRSCVSDALQTDMNTRQGVMLVDSRNYNYDDDRWFRDYKSDKRWNRRSNVLALGRNLSSMALGYGQVASQIFGQVGKQYNLVGQSMVNALGYFGARNDTYIPNTYLGSGGQGVTGSIISIGVPGGIGAPRTSATAP